MPVDEKGGLSDAVLHAGRGDMICSPNTASCLLHGIHGFSVFLIAEVP